MVPLSVLFILPSVEIFRNFIVNFGVDFSTLICFIQFKFYFQTNFYKTHIHCLLKVYEYSKKNHMALQTKRDQTKLHYIMGSHTLYSLRENPCPKHLQLPLNKSIVKYD
uniref:(northern house mosquito) hypothetical protein n=1 Tax=Culex pipiens TaxID=7175 RepID=A0A8D8A4W2_CULPI